MNWYQEALEWVAPFSTPAATLGLGTALFVLTAGFLIYVVEYLRVKRRLSRALDPRQLLVQTILGARQMRAAMGRPVALQSPAGKGQVDAVAAHAGITKPTLHVKIYVDCSNLSIDWGKLDRRRLVDWELFPRLVLEALAARPEYKDRIISYRGCNVYGSYYEDAYYDLLAALNEGTAKKAPVAFRAYKKGRLSLPSDGGAPVGQQMPASHGNATGTAAADKTIAAEIAGWRAENTAIREVLLGGLNRQLGYSTFAVQRRTPQSLPTATYTSDGVPIAAEKQVDTRFCTEMIADAVYDIYDVAVVVSADEDFVPAIEFLGRQVIQLGHKAFSRSIREHASGHIDLQTIVKASQDARSAPVDPRRATA